MKNEENFEEFFLIKMEEFLLNRDIKDKSIYDFFYDLEIIDTTIITGDKENILLNFIEVRIYSNKCEDPYEEHHSIGEIETPFIISYSSEIEDYILLLNFPRYIIDEDSDNMNHNTGIRNLTFNELVDTFNKMKVIDMSKIEINDSDNFTYFENVGINGDNADEQLEDLKLDNNSLIFIDKTAFINKLKNLDENSVIEIRFDSKKWSINEKSIVTGEWKENEYTLHADVLQKNAYLMWEKSLCEIINLLEKNELGELNNDNCKSLYLNSSDGSDINVIKIEWDSSLTDEEEEQFKEEFGDDGSQLYYDGDLEVELYFETGAIIGIRVITDEKEFHLSEEDNEIDFEEDEFGNDHSTARASVLLDDEDKKEMESAGWLLHFLAFGYFLTGDFISAIDSINKVIELDINDECESSEHYTTSAKINLKLNNKEKAINDLKKALELDPDYAEAIQLLKSLK